MIVYLVSSDIGVAGEAEDRCRARIIVDELFDADRRPEEEYVEARKRLEGMREDDGCPEASYALMEFYMRGVGGVDQDFDKASALVKEGADRGDRRAQFQLAFFYERGFGSIKKDYGRAVQWFERSSDQGYLSAIDRLISVYSEGRLGEDEDPEKVSDLRDRKESIIEDCEEPC